MILLLCACGSSSSKSSSDGGQNVPNSEEKELGPEGGNLRFGPVLVEVSPGAVAAPTTFRITESERTPSVPNNMTAVSKVFRLEPATQYSAPIRVVLDVDRSRVGARQNPSDGLLLLRAPSGTDDFEVIGGADLEATSIEGVTTEFSDFVVALFQLANCTVPAPENCAQTLAPAGSQAGACTLRTADGRYTASCAVDLSALRVSCTCASEDPGRQPITTGPLLLASLQGGTLAATAHTFLTRCGWPCGDGVAQADAGVADASSGTTDAGTPDAGSDDGGAPGPSTPFVSNLYYPDWLLIEGQELFAAGGGVTRIDLATSMRTSFPGWAYPNSLGRVPTFRLDATTLWTTVYDDQTGQGMRLTKTPRAGGMPTEVAPEAILVTVDATRVYYLLPSGIFALPKAGGSATKLCDSPALGAYSAVIDDTHIYAVGADSMIGQLYKIPLAGGDCSVPIANSAGGPAQLMMDGDTLYWSHDPAGTIERVTKAGVVTPWTSGQHAVRQLAQDATHVYWSTLSSQVGAARRWEIRKKAKAGNELPVTIVRDIEVMGEISGVAVDAEYVYWGDAFSPGAIYRARK